MSARSPLVVLVTDVLHSRGGHRPIRMQVPVDFGIEFSRVAPGHDLDIDLTVSRVSGGLMVRGTLSGVMSHTCARCLKEWEEDFEIEVAELFGEDTAAEEDAYQIDHDEIDLEPMLRDAVLLSVPLVPSCGEDCDGLGRSDETDLNSTSGASTSPFAVLKELLPDSPN
ncbi:MAG: DUF177 domain-containing protein, partial [Acidimicrobiia bacterium]|nr:DUF177 domain-containing protein [Acidimicrobiia bacterium]